MNDAILELIDKLPFTPPKPSGIAFDPSVFDNEKDWRDTQQVFLQAIAHAFEKRQEVPNTFGLFARRGPDGAALNEVLYTELFRCTELTKAMFARYVKFLAHEVDAAALIHISETWIYTGKDKAGLRAHQAQNDGSYEGFEGVGECVTVTFQRADAFWYYSAAIVRGDGPARLEPWVEKDYTHAKGRFVGMLEPAPGGAEA